MVGSKVKCSAYRDEAVPGRRIWRPGVSSKCESSCLATAPVIECEELLYELVDGDHVVLGVFIEENKLPSSLFQNTLERCVVLDADVVDELSP